MRSGNVLSNQTSGADNAVVSMVMRASRLSA